MMPRLCYCLLLLLLVCAPAMGQIRLNVSLRTPTPAALSEWERDATIIRLTVTNTSTNEYRNVRFSFFIRNIETGTIVARTQNNDPAMPRFTIPAAGVLNLNGPDIIRQDAIDVDGSLQTEALTTGQLPEGTYQYCVDVIDERGTSLSSTGEACTVFRIIVPDPPDLIYPVSESISGNRTPTFRWTPVVLPGASVRYRILVKARLDGQTARQALESNGPSLTMLEQEVTTASYPWQASDRQFDDPTLGTSQFVWQIQAVDQFGAPAARNNGRSSIGEFWTGSGSSSGGMTLAAYYPVGGDTLPWQPPHLIIRWGDYSDDITQMEYTLTVRNASGGVVGTNSRTLRWGSGVMESQGVTTVDRARLIIVNYTNTCTLPAWMNSLPRGREYSWQVEATFTRRNGTTSTMTSAPARFAIGLRVPQNRGPADGATVPPSDSLRLRWQVPEPRQLNFTPTDILTRFHAEGCMQFTPAFESMRVQLARSSSFASVLRDTTVSIPGTSNFVTGDAMTEMFAAQAFRPGAVRDTGEYFWRVSYLNADGSVYATGPVWRFRIGADSSSAGGDSISTSECIRLIAASPEANGRWTAGRRPRFSVLSRPVINLSAVTGGRLSIYRMNSPTEDTTAVLRRTPVFDQSFSGGATGNLRARSAMGGGTVLPLDLAFVNESGSPYTFDADSGASYIWRFTLNYTGASIRSDGVRCTRSSTQTSLAKFTIGSSDSSECADICSATAPTDRTPARRSFRVEDELHVGRFTMRLTRVTGSSSAMSGEGTIAIPFLNNARVNVQFAGISVNEAGEMYEGTIQAKQDAVSPLSQEDANRLTGALGITESQSQSLNTLVSQTGRLASGLAMGTPMSLPIGFDNVVEGERVVIAVVGMVFRPTDARFNASAYMTLPFLGPDAGVGLAARDICIHPNGIGGDGRALLCLAVDHGYRDPGAWSFVFKAPSTSDSGTCVMFDCHGFQWLRIHAQVEFPRDWVVKAPSTRDTGLVKADFMTTIRRTGDFICSATMDRFSPAGATDFELEARDIVLDMSERDNPPTIAWPERYSGDRTNRWRGIYIGRIAMTLPTELRTFDSTRPIQIELRNASFGFRDGFNFQVNAVNVIQYPTGNFGEWGASIDTLGIAFVNSSLEGGHMMGRFQIPISDSAIDYRATLAQVRGSLQFNFSVQPRDTINATLWVARMHLNPTSRIELMVRSDSVYAAATLSGGLGIAGDVGGVPGLNFTGMEFQNMRISSVDPYFEQGTWGHASPQHSTAGFPVSISDLGVVSGERDRGIGAGLRFTLSVNIQQGSNGISGGTTLSIWGVMPRDGGPQRFEFDGIDLDSIGIGADLGAVELHGGVRLYRRDPVFGTGFRGVIDATFIKQINIRVTAQFGSVGTGGSEYRYWYVDALARFQPGVMVFTGVGIYGFGGGAWHHMRREAMPASREGSLLQGAPIGSSPRADSSNPGATNSGYRFVPDRGTELGLRAMVTLGTYPKPDAFNADIALEVEFLSGGGIGRISLLGAGYFMADLNNRSEAKVTATADITYRFPERTFDAQFEVRINASPLTGGGRVVMYASPSTWFFKVGEPDPAKRINITLADWIRIDAYLMVGKDLPFPMTLPPEITSVLGSIPPARSPLINQGDGFAFGASASFNTGRLQFLIFYARFALTLGFDVGLLNNGSGARCEGTGQPMGIDGWYAMGQFYAYFRGSIGIYVDLWFVSGEFEILDMELAAMLRAGAPNPTWLQGVVGGRYSILGGAVRGNCRYEFEVGEECTPMRENPLASLDLISEIQPPDGSRNVPFDVEPQAAFNFAVDSPFEIVENRSDGSQRVRTFRVRVRDFNIREDGGRTLTSSWRRTRDSMQAVLTPGRPLDGERWYRSTVEAYGQERIGSSWQNAQKLDGTPINQSVSTRFLTAQPPDTIVPDNVQLSYPRYRQRFFLQDECPTGSIYLHTDQGYLFHTSEGVNRYTYHAKFIPLPAGSPAVEVPVRYVGSGRSGSIQFDLPTLQNDQIYALQIVRRAMQVRSDVAALSSPAVTQLRNTALRYGNLSEKMTLQNYLREYVRDSNSLVETRNRVTGFQLSRQTARNEELLYVYHFRTSRFNTLSAKLGAVQFSDVDKPLPLAYFELYQPKQTGVELFDEWDMEGSRYTYRGQDYNVAPLVQVESYRRDSRWHSSYVNPWIYDIIDLVERMRRRNINTYWERAIVRRSLAQYESGARGQLNDNEISPPPPSTGGTNRFAGIQSTGYGFVPATSGLALFEPRIRYSFEHGITIPLDWSLMRSEVASILACCSGEFMSPAEELKLRQALARSYQMMYSGTYNIDFSYNYCIDPDTPATRYREGWTK